jgi:hypothetical protein
MLGESTESIPNPLRERHRSWRVKYGSEWRWAITNRYETDMALRLNTHFFVGTVHEYQDSWIIVGLFYPPV